MDMTVPSLKIRKPIYVTQPALPPPEEFIPYLQQIWDKKILTNDAIALATAHSLVSQWHQQWLAGANMKPSTVAQIGQYQ